MHAAVWSAKTNFQNVLIDDVDGRHATSSPTSTTKVRGPISGVFLHVCIKILNAKFHEELHDLDLLTYLALSERTKEAGANNKKNKKSECAFFTPLLLTIYASYSNLKC